MHMAQTVRTDLAMEAREASGEVDGVLMQQHVYGSATVTKVVIKTKEGARKLGKPGRMNIGSRSGAPCAAPTAFYQIAFLYLLCAPAPPIRPASLSRRYRVGWK